MGTVTLTFDPAIPAEVDNAQSYLDRFKEPGATAPAGAPPASPPASSPDAAPQFEKAVTKEFDWVTDGARKALRFILEQEKHEVPFDHVTTHMGMTGLELSGTMSSYGHSAKTIGSILDRDYNRRVYLVDVTRGAIVLKLLNKFDEQLAKGAR